MTVLTKSFPSEIIMVPEIRERGYEIVTNKTHEFMCALTIDFNPTERKCFVRDYKQRKNWKSKRLIINESTVVLATYVENIDTLSR